MKFGLINFCLFLLTSSTFSEAKHKSYGGTHARDGQFPFAVALNVERWFCGASIIHERWVLTAAHCIFGYNANRSHVSVGSVHRYESLNIRIEKFYTHPDYVDIPEDENNIEYLINDIGLVRLASNLTFNDKVQPIKLATEEDGSYENSIATVSGWGKAGVNAPLPELLRYINVRVLTRKECRKAWPYADKHICTSTQEYKGICKGDSGSPLVVGDVQIGITSTTDEYCESLKPDMYTKVASFVPWIKSVMSQHGDVLHDP